MESRSTAFGCEEEVLLSMDFIGFIEIKDNQTAVLTAADAFLMGEIEKAHSISIDVEDVLEVLKNGFKKKFNEISCVL